MPFKNAASSAYCEVPNRLLSIKEKPKKEIQIRSWTVSPQFPGKSVLDLKTKKGRSSFLCVQIFCFYSAKRLENRKHGITTIYVVM